MNFDELCNCENCPLKLKKKVHGELVGEAREDGGVDVVVVGIAPARAEEQEGRPMVGWSGQVLRSTLKKAGIESYYITNTILCVLPKEEEELGYGSRTAALTCCSKRLVEEVGSLKPKLAIALGNVPLESLTGEAYKVRSVAGRVLPGLICDVLPVVHPASLSRRPEEFFDFVDGVRVGKHFLSGSYARAAIPDYVVATPENFNEVLQALDNAELLAVDLETTGRGFFPYGREPDKIRCINVATSSNQVYLIPGESSPYFEAHPNFVYDDRLKEIINSHKCIFHNGPFDIGFLLQAGYKPEIYFDTFIGHYVLDERTYSHGLKPLAAKYLGAPDWEADIKKYLPNKKSSYDLIPTEVLYQYAACDSAYTYQLSEEVGFRKQVQPLPIYKDLLNPCANMFAEIRHVGLPIDVEYLMQLDSILEVELEEKIKELQTLIGHSINPFSPKEVAELLYDELGFQEVFGYGRSTAEKVLAMHGGPICELIKEVREFGKLKSTYVVGVSNFIDYDFRVHPFTKLHGTVTGRLSTTDPNIMNVHKKGGVRKLYLPEDGHLILEADQKQVELRCYALVSQDAVLMQRFLNRDDPHADVNADLNRRTGKIWERDKAKAGVFGRIYGRGKRDFIESYGLSNEDADALIAAIDRNFPSIYSYRAMIQKTIHEKGCLTSYFGRKRRFGLLLDSNKHEAYRQGANFLIQSMATDINLYTMLHLWKNRNHWGIKPLFPVHDSVVMDIPEIGIVPEIKKEMETYSMSLVENKVPFLIDCSVGKSWGDAKKLVIEGGKILNEGTGV